MNVVSDFISSMVYVNPWLEDLKDDCRIRATDTLDNVEHIFYVSVDDELKKSNSLFVAVSLRFEVIFKDIENVIAKALGDTEPWRVSCNLWLSEELCGEKLLINQEYLIDVSSDVAKKKSLSQFFEMYNKKIEPLRKKMRSQECLDDYEFYPDPRGSELLWEMRRIVYLFLYRKEKFKSYIDGFKDGLKMYIEKIDAIEKELGNEHNNLQVLEDGELAAKNIFVYQQRKWLEEANKILWALENS